jgi:hypothetical protein
MKIKIQRQEVHPADVSGLEKFMTAEGSATLGQFVQDIQDGHFLPHINGGAAVWVIFPDVEDKTPIGVVAQQWKNPKLINGDIILADYFKGKNAVLRFDYYTQFDPDVIFTHVQNGDLPPKYEL